MAMEWYKNFRQQVPDLMAKYNKKGTYQVGAIPKPQKVFESHTVTKKNRKGGPFSLARFCRLPYVKNGRGTLCTKFALAGHGLSLSSFSSFEGAFRVRKTLQKFGYSLLEQTGALVFERPPAPW